MTGIERLHEITTRLRNPETGCPWDRVQTLQTLKPCVLEETYELLAAMDKPEDQENHIEELGDVLLQVMFQSVMAEQEGKFTFDDVANAVADKLVRRHPHVFGNVDANDEATVMKNWERIKQMEHRKELRHSALDGVPDALPALLKAQRSQEKAARIGYEQDVGVAGKSTRSPREDFGLRLFEMCKEAKRQGIDAESALNEVTAQFAAEFRQWEDARRTDTGK